MDTQNHCFTACYSSNQSQPVANGNSGKCYENKSEASFSSKELAGTDYIYAATRIDSTLPYQPRGHFVDHHSVTHSVRSVQTKLTETGEHD